MSEEKEVGNEAAAAEAAPEPQAEPTPAPATETHAPAAAPDATADAAPPPAAAAAPDAAPQPDATPPAEEPPPPNAQESAAAAAAAAEATTAPADSKSGGRSKTRREKSEKPEKGETARRATDSAAASKRNSRDSEKVKHKKSRTSVDSTAHSEFINDSSDSSGSERERHDSAFSRYGQISKALKAAELAERDPDILRQVEEPSSSESEESDDSQYSYVQQKELEVKPDFFDVLGEIPSLGSISLDLTELGEDMEAAGPKVSLVEDPTKDVGQFVDPLTGAPEPEDEPAPEAVPEEPEAEGVEEQGEEEESEEEDLLLPPEIEDEVPLEKVDDDGLNLWYSIEPQRGIQVEALDLEALERLEIQRQNVEATRKLIDEMIAIVVEKCEYVDPNVILRQNLDKVKIMAQLHVVLSQLEVEQKARLFVNRKTVEYFRRKKAFRSISEDNPDVIAQVVEKYKEATMALDQLLSREEETRNRINLRLEELEGENFDIVNQAKASIQQFEDLVRKTLHREHFEKLPAVIEGLLQKLSTQREEISRVRTSLILRQHTFAKILERTNKLENIGDGLHMRDFEHLQTETLALSKKIEERNSELGKLRVRCNADLHIMAHLKEKQQMMCNTILVQESAFRELLEEKQLCRENLYELKVQRGVIRKEIRELSFQGGLIDKHALMLDYDETAERREMTLARVELKRQRLVTIQQHIQALEEGHQEYE